MSRGTAAMPCSSAHGGSRSRVHTSQLKLHARSGAALLLLQLAFLALLLTQDHNSSSKPTAPCSSSSSCCGRGGGHILAGQGSGLLESMLPWLQLPGAAAEFTDDLMRAAAKDNATVSGKLYDTANNWSTLQYTWKAPPAGKLTGTWDAPQQQLQWWMGKRQLQTTVTKVPLPSGQPEQAALYKTRGQSLNVVTCGAISNSNIKLNEAEPLGRSAQVFFVYNSSGPCGGKLWLPEGVTIHGDNSWSWELSDSLLGRQPKRPRLSTREELDGFLDSEQPGWNQHGCSIDQSGDSAADTVAARDLLGSLLLPGGADITWKYSSECAHQSAKEGNYYGSWKLTRAPGDDAFGPNAVYSDGRYPAPVPDEPYEDTDDVNVQYWYYDDYYINDENVVFYTFKQQAIINPSLHHVRFGLFDSGATYAETFSAGYFHAPAEDNPVDASQHGYPVWYGVSWCPDDGGAADWTPGVTCTLSITPVQTDTADTLPTCAASLPQGIPFITCRAEDGALLEMNSTLLGSFKQYQMRATSNGQRFNRPLDPPAQARSAVIVAGVDLIISPQSSDATRRTIGSSGKLPDVACNKRAHSPRFGGRCAAPVVQYLAYDEAYHVAANRAPYGLPEYGGCLAGGLMRYLGSSDAPTWNAYSSWWTPPLWPADSWYNLNATLGDSAKADAFLDDQASLNSLYVYQKEFKLAVDRSPAGCTKLVLELGASKTRWCVVPKSDGSNRLEHVVCPTHSKDQCFHVDGDLAVGARIRHANNPGLCIGLLLAPPGSWPPAPSMVADAARMLPCSGSDGYVKWRQASPGTASYLQLAAGPACTGASNQPRECRFAVCFVLPYRTSPGPVQVIDTLFVRTVPESHVLSSGRANYKVETHAPVWDSFKTLKNFWQSSFASSAVDLRAHRTHFTPPGGRQGPLGRSAVVDGSRDVCDAPATYAEAGITPSKESCGYNAKVKLASKQFTSDSCAADWLAATSLMGENTMRAPVCYPGSSFLYTHVNKCAGMSNDMRLTDLAGGPGADKCMTTLGANNGRLVAADDLWSAIVSYEHDPCGWPFVECVADCSLPSDIAGKGWTEDAQGQVKDSSAIVGKCSNAACDGAQDTPMLHPRVANQIGAIDWRNLTLYTPQLDFSAFRGAPGRAVWYLNLNFNMLGGNLTALDELPDIFPNLIHLGLAHCSAGKFAPEYSWQQAQTPYCHERWVDGWWNETTGPNPACYCPDDSWKNMGVIPNVGKALQLAADGQRQAGLVTGVTRMMYGSIPRSWGRAANGSLAAWHSTLLSVNLAGHHTITGDLPAEWYDQAAFPKLYYLKVKGTGIQPNLTIGKLKWQTSNKAVCDAVRWNDYSTAPNSVLDVTQACTGGACTACDWWPLRSAAPWYYSQVNCTGEWAWSECNSTCAGGVKFMRFSVKIPAANGGTCQWLDGEYNETSTAGCPTNPCPVDCEGAWTDWSACNGTCGPGMQASTYVISGAAQYGGEECPYAHNTARYQDCVQWDDTCTTPSFLPASDVCNTTSDGQFVYVPEDCDCATGTRNMTFTYDSTGMSQAKNDSCATIAGAALDGEQNFEVCEAQYLADCTGSYSWGACSVSCGGGSQTGTYVRQPPGKCGRSCDELGLPADGSTTTRACNEQVCTGSDCVFEWAPLEPCNVTCGLGAANSQFVVTAPAWGDGAACEFANGTQQLRTCNATQGCPCIANWTDWSMCNASCGYGSQFRTFVITQAAAPVYTACDPANNTVEWQPCILQQCPVNCTASWTDWGPCNATCDGGNRSRVFQISVESAYGGAVCPLANETVEWEPCGLHPCPINCTGNWTDWGACNATCGGGNQSRVFEVSSPAAYNGSCEAEDGTLNWQACNTQPCPINCTGDWSEWEACSVPCGGGNQTSTFLVSLEAMHGGSPCSEVNATARRQACNLQHCPVNCTGNWTDWGACNASCGGGNQSRVFEVSTPAAYNGSCEAENGTLDWQACNTQPCPVDCVGNWTDWEACNVPCGGGNQTSTFLVSVGALYGGSNCSEVNATIRWQDCNLQPCPVDCTGNWTDWGACNATCAGGNQSRVFYIIGEAAHGGANCSHSNETLEERACNTQPCPVDCAGSWTAWSGCNQTCGSGTRTRVFEVSVPAAFSGQACPAGNGTIQSEVCNAQPCPVNCTGTWSPWGACNVTCGGGNSSRMYGITTQAVGTGDACPEADGAVEWRACNTQACAPPQLGQGEEEGCPGLTADMYLPRGTAVPQLPVLVAFASPESRAAYCPDNSTSGEDLLSCTVSLQALPVLQTDATLPGPVQETQLDCLQLTALTCRMVLPLGPVEAKYAVTLLPIDNLVLPPTCTSGSFDPVEGEVILDSSTPSITSIQLDVAPTVQLPIFKLLITFSEPVSWLANSTAPTEDPGTPVTYSSSRLLLTNAALLNISMVPGTAAVLADGDATNAASGFLLWFRSWSGARAVVEVMGTAYQDFAGNRGTQDSVYEVAVPGTDLLQRASSVASAATAIAASASALSAAAAATTASGAGGATSLLRSVGHTQFLAMSVSLTVPWLPPEYLELCAGLEWSNLVQPASAALQLTSNSSNYADSQLSPSRRRALLSSSSSSEQATVADWLDEHSRQHGSYRSVSAAAGTAATRSSTGDGSLAFSSAGTASNGSLVEGLTNALIMTGTSRWPNAYTARQLQLSIIVLFVVVVAASCLQVAAIGLWKLLRLNPDDLPNLLRFPKPQVVVYTLLMVPVLYGAAKLLSSPLATSADWSAGVATIILVPLPPLAFWAYVLVSWHRALQKAARGDVKRSKSNLLRTYGSGTVGTSGASHTQQQRGVATLALLGDPTDNPTLIIRNKQHGEEAFEAQAHRGSDSSSEDGDWGCRAAGGGGGATAAAAGRPWKARDHSAAGASPRRSAAVSFLPAGAEEEQDGRPIATRSFTHARQTPEPDAGDPPLHRMQSLPGSAETDDYDEDGRPLGEGLEEEEQSSFAEAWQAARAAGQPVSSWGGQAAGSRPAAAAAAAGATAPRTSGRFQLSFSADGAVPAGAQGSADGAQPSKQDTWVGGAGDAAAAEVTQQQIHEVAATQFLAKHGFMVDDLVGNEPEIAIQRSQWKILLLHVVSILQRCLTAVMFGFFHFRFISPTQLGMLIALHAGFIGYLLAVRPYVSWLLLLSDVLAYLCELTVLSVAVLLQRNPGHATHQQLAHALIACYFLDVAAMVVPELIRYLAMGWAWVQVRRARQARQQQGQAQGDPGQMPGVDGEGLHKGQAGRGAAPAGVDGVVTVSKRAVGDKGAAKAAAAAALKLSGSGAR